MAKGESCPRCWVVLAVTLVIVLAATNVWNPFPGIWDWINRGRPLSTPAPLWQTRLGGPPKSVLIADGAAVVEHRTSVEAYGLNSGARLWERKADWAAVAGDGGAAVVVVGTLLTKGYTVLDPTTGATRRVDSEAVAVWTYRDALIDVRCLAAQDCILTAREPDSGAQRWRVSVPGIGFVLFADNPELLGSRPLETTGVSTDANGPGFLPRLLGLPIDGRVHVVDTVLGRVVREVEVDRRDKLVVLGGRVLRIDVKAADSTCYWDVTGRDAATDEVVWRRQGINLRTADGSGCAQRRAPSGQDDVLVGVAPDARELVLDANDGRVLFNLAPEERVVGLDNFYAVIRSADGESIRGMGIGRTEPLWQRETDRDTRVALTRYAVLILERDPDRLIALDPETGAELLVRRTEAKVMAVGPEGIVLTEGRELGYVPFGVTLGPGSVAVPPAGGEVPPAPGTTPTGTGVSGFPGKGDR